jgi:calcium-translocating P-type ATPase
MQDDRALPYHALAAAAALAQLETTSSGLNSADAARRRQLHGANRLPETAGKSLTGVVLHQFQSPFIYLLLAAALLSVSIGHGSDAGFILAVLLLNAAIGGWQEWRAEMRTRGLKSLVRGRLPVWRDGRLVSLDTEDLVPGDIVQVESGVKVPADLRLIEAQALATDESLLTGESLLVEKQADRPVSTDTAVGERSNMLFAGSTVRRGRGHGLVVATGRHSEVGQLAQALQMPAVPSPLQQRMDVFTRQIAIVATVLIGMIALLEILRGVGAADILLLAIALAVSAIPEALPVAMTIVLSISVHRMGLRQVVVRHLSAVEGLGACTLIATDKTGTLTVNRLSIETVWLPGAEAAAGTRVLPNHPRVKALAFAAAHCSEFHGAAAIHAGEEVGDAVDLAFLRLAVRSDYESVLEGIEQRWHIDYEPERRYAAAFHDTGGQVVAYVKGAPETVMALCGVDSWEAARRQDTESAIQTLAGDGYRVIAVAAGVVARPDEQALRGLNLLGFAGLIDPLRPEAPAAVRAARAAGIRVVMITGDHPLTARAIARSLGLIDPADENAVLTGAQLRVLEGDQAGFDDLIADVSVFARTEPLQKLAIVQSLQRQGHLIAVTGDGINDAAALQAADIGVAMGRGGTDVARDAADLILVDDNFASIVAGIEEGRAAYANLRKVILYCVSTGAAELLLMLLATLFGLPPPLTAVQLLWLNLVSNGIQDVALGFEKPEPNLLQEPPRAAGSPIFNRAMLEQVLLSGFTMGLLAFCGYAYALHGLGLDSVAAQGLTLWLLVWCENAHVLNCRSETRSIFRLPLSANWLLIGGVTVTQGLQVAAAHLPGIGGMLRLEGINPVHAAMLALPALGLIAVMEIYKLWRFTLGPAHTQ